MTESKNVLISHEDRLAVLTVNRPEVRNALNRETVHEFRAALEALAEEKSVGAVIITGAGDRAFVSGADIRDLATRRSTDTLSGSSTALFSEIENFPRPVIAAINGLALGGGLELALACDLRVASETARFGFPETGLGIIPGAGGTQRLPRLIGLARAKHIILTGEIFDAGEAARIGLLSRVVPQIEVMNAARQLAETILSRAPLAVRLAKLSLNASSQTAQNAGLLIEALSQGICFGSADKAEGLAAFLEKRKAVFQGE